MVLPGLNDSCKSAQDYIAVIDEYLKNGFSNLSEDEKDGFDDLASIFSGTAIEEPVKNAFDSLKVGNLNEENFSILAASRTSLQGAIYDSLISEFDKQFSISRENSIEEKLIDEPDNIQSTVRHFLTEIAVNGFDRISDEITEPFQQVLDKLSEDRKLINLYALIDGFVNEIQGVSVSSIEEIHAARWADLWSRAMILTQKAPYKLETENVSGELCIIGLDALQHPRFISLKFHGILYTDKKAIYTSFSISSPKVDSIVGSDIWLLFDKIPVLKEAVAKGRSINIENMPIMENGVLLWEDEYSKIGKEFNIFEKAEQLSDCMRFKVPAAQRHLVQINEIVYLNECELKDETIVSGNLEVKIDKRRFYSFSPLNLKELEGLYKVVGILRFDGDWMIQPLTIEKKSGKKVSIVHNGMYSLESPKKGKKKSNVDNVSILRERATRLLRK